MSAMARTSLVTTLGVAFVSAASLFASGCGHTGALREAASEDFNCPERDLHIRGGGRTKDVEGCGQRATYRWTGRTWARESGASMSAPATVGGPPPVTPARPAGPQPIRSQPTPSAPPSTPSTPSTTQGPQAPLPPSQPPPAAPPAPGGHSL